MILTTLIRNLPTDLDTFDIKIQEHTSRLWFHLSFRSPYVLFKIKTLLLIFCSLHFVRYLFQSAIFAYVIFSGPIAFSLEYVVHTISLCRVLIEKISTKILTHNYELSWLTALTDSCLQSVKIVLISWDSKVLSDLALFRV